MVLPIDSLGVWNHSLGVSGSTELAEVSGRRQNLAILTSYQRVDPEPRFLTPSLKTDLGAATRVNPCLPAGRLSKLWPSGRGVEGLTFPNPNY
jgi:hypothetical protein